RRAGAVVRAGGAHPTAHRARAARVRPRPRAARGHADGARPDPGQPPRRGCGRHRARRWGHDGGRGVRRGRARPLARRLGAPAIAPGRSADARAGPRVSDVVALGAYPKTVVLTDGAHVELRLALPGDAPAIAALARHGPPDLDDGPVDARDAGRALTVVA